jgi:hypothetical protein
MSVLTQSLGATLLFLQSGRDYFEFSECIFDYILLVGSGKVRETRFCSCSVGCLWRGGMPQNTYAVCVLQTDRTRAAARREP